MVQPQRIRIGKPALKSAGLEKGYSFATMKIEGRLMIANQNGEARACL
jgi:hypothetical protein